MPNSIYIQADTADYNSPVDIRRADTPCFWRGSATEIRVAVFEHGLLREPADLASITLTLKPLGPHGERPATTDAPLLTKTTTDIDTYLTIEEWLSYQRAHAIIRLSAAEADIAPGVHWFTLHGQTKDNPAQTLVLCAGFLSVEESGL